MEAGSDEFGGVGAGACEEGFIGHFAESEAESGGWDGKDCRTMDGAGEFEGELSVGDGIGCSEVDWARDGGSLSQEEDGGDGVAETDPTHPLGTGAERAAKAEAEDGEHAGKRAGAWSYDDTEAEMDNANARIDGGFGGGFPLPAEVGEEAGAETGGFVEELAGAIAVDADGRGDKERLRRIPESGKQAGEGSG